METNRLVFPAEEAAVLLGISRSTVYRHIGNGTIPSVRIGRRVLVPEAALARLLGRDETARTARTARLQAVARAVKTAASAAADDTTAIRGLTVAMAALLPGDLGDD